MWVQIVEDTEIEDDLGNNATVEAMYICFLTFYLCNCFCGLSYHAIATSGEGCNFLRCIIMNKWLWANGNITVKILFCKKKKKETALYVLFMKLNNFAILAILTMFMLWYKP